MSTSQFRVPEIHCDGCVRSLTGAIRDVDGKAEVEADLASKLVRVRSTAADTAIAEAIRDAGFSVEAA